MYFVRLTTKIEGEEDTMADNKMLRLFPVPAVRTALTEFPAELVDELSECCRVERAVEGPSVV